MKRLLLIAYFISSLTLNISVEAKSKNKETYEHLDLFGKVFDRVRSEYVDEVSDEE